jgi:hypothetical protein
VENGTEKTPKAEGYQRCVEDSEADATVIGEKATYKARGREHIIEPSGVLFDRVAGLGQDQR